MSQFELFGPAHIGALSLTLALPIILAVIVRRYKRAAGGICIAFAAVLLVNETAHWIWRLATSGVEQFVRLNLPLHVCGIAIFAVMVALVFRNRMAYEIAWFWGLAGTTNALVTPQLEVGFPEYRFFQYFIAHGGIVAGALFATWGLGMRPTAMSVVRAFVLLNLLCVVVLGVNWALGSNYMFLMAPPVTQSPFFFAPWPWYIPILDAFALLLFCLLLLPFLIQDRLRRDIAGTGGTGATLPESRDQRTKATWR